MASSTLSPYYNNASQLDYSLVTTSAGKTTYIRSGRPFAQPQLIEITRKPSGGRSNDHIGIRIARVEPNATTNVLATGQITVDISIPKDQSVLTNTAMVELLGTLASLLDQATALNASAANRTALIEGRDL